MANRRITTPALATTEARKALPQLVKRMGAKARPSADLLADAIGIGPHRKGGAVLIPEVDVAAHADEVNVLRLRVEELEEQLGDAGLVLLLRERLATTSGERIGAADFLTGIGMEDHVARLPRP